MSTTWPSTLPQSPLMQGYGEEDQDNVIRSEMETGPAKVRRRFSAIVRTFRVSYSLTHTQLVALQDFYETTLSHGTTNMTYPHPRTGVLTTARLVGPIRKQPNNGKWLVSFTVEVQP